MYKYVSASGLNSCTEMDLGDFFFCMETISVYEIWGQFWVICSRVNELL